MDILVTGAHGLIGGSLVSRFREEGHRVVRLVRGTPTGDDIRWDPARGLVDRDALEGFDAVVHLAGAGIGDRRWTPARKQMVRDSRTLGTRSLATALAGLDAPPRVLVSGSAVGYYGDRGDELLTEDSGAGRDFLADVCTAWEAATRPAADAGIRVVTIRTGIVLAAGGGLLGRLRLPFRLGLGGRLGSGRQYVSWITLDDHLAAIRHVIDDERCAGPVNLTGPNPVTNAELTRALGRALRRPTAIPTPLLPLRLVYGSELVASLLTGGQRVVPARLAATGFVHGSPDLEPALRALLA